LPRQRNVGGIDEGLETSELDMRKAQLDVDQE
jgi:hypothetical protein